MELNYHRIGNGEPLVLMHGIGGRWQWFEPVLSRVAGERDVVAVDLPGFGASPAPPRGTPPGIGSLTRLVSEFLDSIGLDQPHVAGNSLGGWIALELAKRGRVRSATGLSPAGFHNKLEARYQRGALWATRRFTRAIARRADRLMRSSVARTLTAALYYAHPARLAPTDVAADVRAAATAAWFDETLRAITTDRFAGGEQITVPVTIAWGERDRLLLPHQARRAKTAIPAARVITLRGCGHIPMPDDPEQVARVLLEGSAVSARPESAVAGR
jgi:pimeloyl-ACP methyl ester carboxylesterase